MEESSEVTEEIKYESVYVISETSQEVVKHGKNKLLNLPLSRVRQMIKTDPDVNLASSEAVFMIAKCAELFIKTLSREAYVFTSSARKKTLQRKDIDSAVENIDELSFLEGALD